MAMPNAWFEGNLLSAPLVGLRNLALRVPAQVLTCLSRLLVSMSSNAFNSCACASLWTFNVPAVVPGIFFNCGMVSFVTSSRLKPLKKVILSPRFHSELAVRNRTVPNKGCSKLLSGIGSLLQIQVEDCCSVPMSSRGVDLNRYLKAAVLRGVRPVNRQ